MNEFTGMENSGKRLPFYMTFPFSENISLEEEDEMDADMLKSLYPQEARRIWPHVEDTCDQLEYDGSIMFDECPDQNQIHRQVLRIQERLEEDETRNAMDAGTLDQARRRPGDEEQRRRRELIEMLLFQEMQRRRRRRRRFRRHFVY